MRRTSLSASDDEFGRAQRLGAKTGPREVAEALGPPSRFKDKPVTPEPSNSINRAPPE